MRRARALAALLLIALPASGCLGLPFGATEEATARELHAAAGSAAFAWRRDAVLIATAAVEAVNRSDYATFPRAGDLFLDPAPGNGRAPFWAYAYYAPSDRTTAVFTVPARTRSAVEVETQDAPTPSGHGDAAPFRPLFQSLDIEKLLDSDDAMQKARTDARFVEAVAALSKPAFALHLEYAHEEGDAESRPRWSLFATGSEGGAAYAVVDAESGTVERAGPMNASEVPGFGRAPKHTLVGSHNFDGTLSLAEPSGSHAFAVPTAPVGLRVDVCTGRTVPAGQASVKLVGPDGALVHESRPTGPGASARFFLVEQAAAGEHRLDVALVDPSAASDYRVVVRVYAGGPSPDQPPANCAR